MSGVYIMLSVICAGMSCFYAFCWKGFKLQKGLLMSIPITLVCFTVRFLEVKYLTGLDVVWILLFAFVLFTGDGYGKNKSGHHRRIINWRMLAEKGIPAAVAASGYAMLSCVTLMLWKMFDRELIYQISLSGLFLLCAVCVGYYLMQWFPEEEWSETLEYQKEAKGTYGFQRLAVLASGWMLCCIVALYVRTVTVVVTVLEVFCFYGGLFILCLLIENRRKEAELMQARQSYEEMQSYMNVIRSQRHDYNLHVQTMQTLLEGRDDKECRDYFDTLLKDSIEMNRLIPLENPAVGALIYSFRMKAAEEGIYMQIEISNNLEKIVTSAYETNKIIGNLLQNALDETLRMQDKSYGIHLSILKKGEFCLIQVSNKVEDPDVMKDYQYGISKKAGHEGIGLASIRRLALKYNGTVYSRINQDVIYFIAKIPLWVAGGR